jgi:hypothetical protein
MWQRKDIFKKTAQLFGSDSHSLNSAGFRGREWISLFAEEFDLQFAVSNAGKKRGLQRRRKLLGDRERRAAKCTKAGDGGNFVQLHGEAYTLLRAPHCCRYLCGSVNRMCLMIVSNLCCVDWRWCRRAAGLIAVALVTSRLLPSASAQSGTVTRPAAKAASAESSESAAEKDSIGKDWVRLRKDPKGQVTGMQTAIVRYAKAGDKTAMPLHVDLIGAVHIADPGYYKQLNEQFQQYDALLYELVAPEGTVVERGRGTSNAHPIGAMQNVFKDLLELDHQLEDVDYTKKNFVHADMSPEDFQKAMKDRKDSFLQMYFRLIGTAMAHQTELGADGQSQDLEVFSALFAPDRARRLKIVLAKQLSEMESLMVSFGGEDGSVIITDRNKKALEVLKQRIDKGQKTIGIFYGAGHLADMDKRLRSEFGLEPVSVTWLTAWDLAEKK